MHSAPINQISRTKPVPDKVQQTIKVDPYYREYGGVYLGSSSQNPEDGSEQRSEDILDTEEPVLNNIAVIDEEIVELQCVMYSLSFSAKCSWLRRS